MGFDAKRIGVYLWKFIKLSTTTSYRFFRKDPYVGVILIFVLQLYMFLPFYFIVLVVCSPLIVLVAVALRVYFKYKRTKTQNVSGAEKKKCEVHSSNDDDDDDVIILRNDGTPISRQMSRRRNFKDKNKQAGSEKEDDNIVALTANTMELLGLTWRNEDKLKVVQEEQVAVASQSWSRPASMEEDEDDDDQEDRNKAVEWTNYDQKNLMDLGISEMERDKRLETLIAKRRARNDDFSPASISVSRRSQPSGEDLPDSAPPILLPSRNPFDLPYEPLEEKPNLMGGKFHHDFRATQLKDMIFCRHESFTLGTSFGSQPKQDHRSSVFGPYFGSVGDRTRREEHLFDTNRKYSHPDHSLLSLECLEAEQLIETLRIRPSPDLLHKDESQNMKSIDDETDSEYSDDSSEKQFAHEGTSVEEEEEEKEIDVEGMGKSDSSNDKLAEKDWKNSQELNDDLLQSSTAASKMLRSVNETLMSEIMNEEKDKSFEQSEVESQLSTLEEPVPQLLTTVDESASQSDRGNDGHRDQGEVETQASTIEEPVPELLTTVQESSSGSSGEIEIESRHGSEAIQNDKGESESSIKNSDEMGKLVNHGRAYS